MDQNTSQMVAGILLGLVVGVPAGLMIAGVKASLAKVSEAKKAVPAAKKVARLKLKDALFLGFLLLIVLALALGSHRTGA